MRRINTIAIIGGGRLSKQFLREIAASEYIIGVDRGAYWLIANGVTPNIAIGDFDSISSKELEEIMKGVKTVKKYPLEKDATDMELAVEHALVGIDTHLIRTQVDGMHLHHDWGIDIVPRLFEYGNLAGARIELVAHLVVVDEIQPTDVKDDTSNDSEKEQNEGCTCKVLLKRGFCGTPRSSGHLQSSR